MITDIQMLLAIFIAIGANTVFIITILGKRIDRLEDKIDRLTERYIDHLEHYHHD